MSDIVYILYDNLGYKMDMKLYYHYLEHLITHNSSAICHLTQFSDLDEDSFATETENILNTDEVK